MNGACSQFQIKHHNSTLYHSKMNEIMETGNKNTKKIVKKRQRCTKIGMRSSFSRYMPIKPSSYVYMSHTFLFSLQHGRALPIEVEIPSLWVLMEVKLDEAEWVRIRYEQLNLIKNKRLTNFFHGQLYQKRMIQAYNKKISPIQFREGELVLKRVSHNQQDHRGKWQPN